MSMSVPLLPDFTRWSTQELHKAENAAIEFLNGNIETIADTFDKRLCVLERVSARMRSPEIDFEERMLCLAAIQELSEGLGESARQFFEIGSSPAVASVIAQSNRLRGD
jgi:hypothetical protein